MGQTLDWALIPKNISFHPSHDILFVACDHNHHDMNFVFFGGGEDSLDDINFPDRKILINH